MLDNTGEILRVDLAAGTVRREPTEPDWLRHWLGGRGLAEFLAWGRGRTDESPLVVAAGALAGLEIPGADQAALAGRSALGPAVGRGLIPGSLAGALRRAGLRAVVITGQAAEPTGLEIDGPAARLVPADELAGAEVPALTTALAGKGATLFPGPAAWQGVAYANLAADRWHACGAGLGLDWAARNLVYLTARGDAAIPVAEPAALGVIRADIQRLICASTFLTSELGLGGFGTGALFDLAATRRMTPTAGFKRTWFEAASQVNLPALRQRYGLTDPAGLVQGLARVAVTNDGEPLPGLEAASHFTALLENTDPDLLLAATEHCHALGLDPAGAALALAIEGEITREGLSSHCLPDRLKAIAAGGEEERLGRGVAALAAAADRADLALAVKGRALPALDPRGAYGLALEMAVATGGADYLSALALGPELLRKPAAMDRFSWSGKARLVKTGEDRLAAGACLGVDPWALGAVAVDEYARAWSAVTGGSLPTAELLRIGERVVVWERWLNAEAGLAAEDDDLPPSFFVKPGTSGEGVAVNPLSREEFLETRARYYRLRGVDSAGRPGQEKARELELPGV